MVLVEREQFALDLLDPIHRPELLFFSSESAASRAPAKVTSEPPMDARASERTDDWQTADGRQRGAGVSRVDARASVGG